MLLNTRKKGAQDWCVEILGLQKILDNLIKRHLVTRDPIALERMANITQYPPDVAGSLRLAINLLIEAFEDME